MPIFAHPLRLMIAFIVLGFATQVLGVLLWLGATGAWRPLHIICGFVLVAGLWGFAARAHRNGAPRWRTGFAVFWGLVVIALGFWQSDLLVGERHHVIRGLHLFAGLAAMVQIRKLAGWVRIPVGGGA